MLGTQSPSRLTTWAGLLAIATAAPATQGQVVSFGLPDYAELGLVRESVRTAYEELDAAELQLQAAIGYADVAITAVNQASTVTNISNAATSAAQLYSALSIISQTVDAENVEDLADALSPFDTSAINGSLSELTSALSTLNGQVAEPIQPPTLYTYYAAAVSGRARDLVIAMRADALTGRASLLNALNNIGTLDMTLADYAAQIIQTRQLVNAVNQQLAEFLEIPIVNLIVQGMIIDLLAYESQLIFLGSQVSGVRSYLDTTAYRVSQRIGEVDELILALDYALTSVPLPSSWVTQADVGGASAYYSLSFAGEVFDHPYTEIDGPFLLGTLSVTNFITPGGGGTSLNATVQFQVTRYVLDPLLGPVTTEASVPLHMDYYASPNDSDNCGSSRDSFGVSALGIDILICETATRSFAVYGQYDSPLQIVSIEALPDDTDPDPAVEHYAHTLHVIDGTGSGVYVAGVPVIVDAVPPADRAFVRWDGDVEHVDDPSAAPTAVTMPSSNVELRAIFAPEQPVVQLTVIDGSGGGAYPEGTEVAITADTLAGYDFLQWTGDVEGVADAFAPVTVIELLSDALLQPLYALGDDCPDDPAKTEPGLCGCGQPEESLDGDGDGLVDCIDACPDSDFGATVAIAGIDSTVANQVLGGGCTMLDQINQASALAESHGHFVSMVAEMTNLWRDDGLITGQQKGLIQSCAAQSDLP